MSVCLTVALLRAVAERSGDLRLRDFATRQAVTFAEAIGAHVATFRQGLIAGSVAQPHLTDAGWDVLHGIGAHHVDAAQK